MASAAGIEQHDLQRLAVRWGPNERPYRLIVPLFDSGYKVLGLAAVDRDLRVTWYPGAPWKVEPRQLAYKDLGTEGPPPWSEVPTGLLEGCYFFDPSGVITLMVPRQPGAPSLAGAVNLAGTSLRGQPVQDVVFESALHRVRALTLRGRWGRPQRVSVMRLGPLPRGLPVVSGPSAPAAGGGAMPLPTSPMAPIRTARGLTPASAAARGPAPMAPLSSGTPAAGWVSRGPGRRRTGSGGGRLARLLRRSLPLVPPEP